MTLPEKSNPFKNSKGKAEYYAAYDATMSQWPVSFESIRVPTRAGLTHVIASGPKGAPPLVLLPMTLMSATMWIYSVGELSRSYRVYAVDTVGDVGKSLPEGPLSTRIEITNWLSDVLDSLGLRSAHVAGASYGGCMALGFAMDAPDRVRSVALLGPAAAFVPLHLQFYLRGALLVMLPRKFTLLSFLRWCSTRKDFKDNLVVQQMHAGIKNIRFHRENGLFAPVYKDLELQNIKMRVLLLVGDRERVLDLDRAMKRAKELVPNIVAEIVPKASHALPIDQPDLINKRLISFFGEQH